MRNYGEQQANDFELGDPLGQWQKVPPDWSKRSLWELAQYINGRAFKPSDFSPTGLRIIKITELKYGISASTAHYDGDYEEKHALQKDDLLFAWSGNPETSLDVFWWRDGKALLNQHIFRLIPGQEIDKQYLFYLLKFLRPTFIRTARDKATSMGHVKVSDLRRLVAFVPATCEQRAISQLLSPLDQKIELNRKMNETLEAMARAIFKSWFVEFDPVRAKMEGRQPFGMDAETAALFPASFQDSSLGKIPNGWRVCKLSGLCATQYGFTASATEEPVGPKFLRVTDINKRNWIEWDSVPYCTIGEEERPRYALGVGDIVVARMADPGKSAIIDAPIDAVFASYLVRLKTTSLSEAHYVYGFLKSDAYREYSEGALGGSVQANMNAKVIVGADLVVPPNAVMAAFSDQILPIRRLIIENLSQSSTLASLRDTLLPKLISGEIRLKDAEKFAEAKV